MKDKKLKQLNRKELIDIIYRLQKDNRNLNERLRNTTDSQEKTDEKKITSSRQGYCELSYESVLEERNRLRKRNGFRKTLINTIFILIVAAASAVLISTFCFPILRIYGNSMASTLNEGDLVAAIKGSSIQNGDVIAMYYGNKLLVKRVIAGPGQLVDISEDGTVTVDGEEIYEPYLIEKAYGDVNINLPYQVPDGRFFVMGDHRETSSDSRNTAVGCVAQEQIVGRIFWRLWPIDVVGTIK